MSALRHPRPPSRVAHNRCVGLDVDATAALPLATRTRALDLMIRSCGADFRGDLTEHVQDRVRSVRVRTDFHNDVTALRKLPDFGGRLRR
jgi:hypothetical protein